MSGLSTPKKNASLSYENLTKEQIDAVDRLYDYDNTLLIAFMGSGKTVVALTALNELIANNVLNRILILAPKKVCESVWSCEHEQWQHLQDVSIAVATGTPKNRADAIQSDARIVVTNFENLPWLVNQTEFKQFDGLLVDELTKLKGGGAQFKALRKHIKQFKWRTGMTGTLVSENLESLFYQAMIVDNGKTFGKNKQNFLFKYFYPTDRNGYKWAVKPNADKEITTAFKPFIHSLPDYRDSLPSIAYLDIATPLPPHAIKIYDAMRKGMEAEGVTAESVAIQVMKLQQIATGFLYRDDPDDVVNIHNAKLEAVEKYLKPTEKIGENGSSGNFESNVVIVYQFKEELARLRDAYPDAPVLGAGVTAERLNAIVTDWNDGRVPVLLLHPKSAGHGLNLAKGGRVLIWFSPVWSRDLFDQTNARLWRRGQSRPVEIVQLIAPDTVEPLIQSRVEDKAGFMAVFLSHLTAI
jgi:hypothetical protein